MTPSTKVLNRLTRIVDLWDRSLLALKTWWRAWWLRLSIFLLLAVVALLLNLWWFVGTRTGTGGATLIVFFDSLVGIGSVFLGGAVTIATAYSASRAARAVELTEERRLIEEDAQKRGRVDALIAASLEAGAYAGWTAHLQQRGLMTWRRFLPEPVAQRKLTLESWRQLSSAVVSASKALERIRYEDPELADRAASHYALVADLHESALKGKIEELNLQGARIRESADELWKAVPSA